MKYHSKNFVPVEFCTYVPAKFLGCYRLVMAGLISRVSYPDPTSDKLPEGETMIAEPWNTRAEFVFPLAFQITDHGLQATDTTKVTGLSRQRVGAGVTPWL
jgi:hypothetical protein